MRDAGVLVEKEIEELIHHHKKSDRHVSLFDAERVFLSMDKDNSGTVIRSEMSPFLLIISLFGRYRESIRDDQGVKSR